MPNDPTTVRDQRILAQWRTRACTAGLCAGTQIFLAGCATGMPLALSGAWLAALATLPFCAWLTLRCRQRWQTPSTDGKRLRFGYLALALSLLGSAAFAGISIVGFAAQTLVQQSRPIWTEAAAWIGIFFCTLSGPAGASRLSFALRYVLAALVLGLSVTSVPMRVPVGLFPILGTGANPLGTAALCMLFGASPVLLLMLPPGELSNETPTRVIPGRRFILMRVMAGALAGIALLFLTCACTTYESIAQSSEWGARLRMAAGNQPHEGIFQMILILAKLMAMLLLAANMLCAAQQALALAIPACQRGMLSLIIVSILLAVCFAVSAVFGDTPILFAAPLITFPAAAAALILGRRRHG